MNKKAIDEIAEIIHVGKYITLFCIKKLTAKQIIKTYEYKMFKKKYPELCRLAEEQ